MVGDRRHRIVAKYDNSATLPRVQDFGIFCDRAVDVVRGDGSRQVRLTFRGVRDAPHVSDKDTRVRVTMPTARAVELRHQLIDVVPGGRLDWQPEVLELLETHRGELGHDEHAVDVLRRLSQAWREAHA